MSTASSLAAAKKRRGPQYNNNNNNNNQLPENKTKNSQSQDFKHENLTNIELLRRHEMRLYNLEKLYTGINKNNLNENSEYITKADLELLQLEKNISTNNSKYDNILENNKEEISTLKNNIQNLTKTFDEINSIIQQLKGTIITQENEITLLKEKKENKED